MLPPFVPPSARVSNEILPLITEFVIDRVEHSFDNSFSPSGSSASEAVATLPSIDEFVHERPQSGSDEEFVQRTSRNPWGAYEAQLEGEGAALPSAALEPDVLGIERRSPPAGSEDAVVNEIAEPADAWAASAATPAEDLSHSPMAPTQLAPEVWVAEERDAFDWHGVANLAVPPAEEQRAAEEWSSTEWERSGGSVQDHVASLVAQVARRVRSGELQITGTRQMGPEAALVAVLSALLAESGRQ
jgi:hypothetical protein